MKLSDLLQSVTQLTTSDDGISWYPLRPSTAENIFITLRVRAAIRVLAGKSDAVEWDFPKKKGTTAPATAPAQPAWHDAPNAPGLWVCLRDSRHKSYRVRDIEVQVTIPEDGDRWYGPIPEDKP